MRESFGGEYYNDCVKGFVSVEKIKRSIPLNILFPFKKMPEGPDTTNITKIKRLEFFSLSLKYTFFL